jgi:hypothetical protein
VKGVKAHEEIVVGGAMALRQWGTEAVRCRGGYGGYSGMTNDMRMGKTE